MPSDEQVRDEARRERVLRLLRASAEPMGVAALADRLGVHPNTARFHLDALVRAGRVERAESVAAGRGRPAARYRALPVADREDRRYEVLAEILVESFGAVSAAQERAANAAAAWGRRHAERGGGDDASAFERLIAHFDEAGFAPHRTAPGVVELHNCPFREVVEIGGDLVCAVHAGMVRGTLAGWGAAATLTALERFPRPGVCVARLEQTAATA